MQATLANYRWISEIIFHARGPAVRRLTHTEIKKLQEMLRVLPTQLLMMKNTSNLKRKSSILLHVKRRESTRQSFPTKKNGKRNIPGLLVRILVMVCFVRHAWSGETIQQDQDMFCETCLKWGNPPAGSRGAWKTRGITNWNHGTELLKQHADSSSTEMLQPLLLWQGRRRVGSRYLSSNVQVLHNRLLNVGREIDMF